MNDPLRERAEQVELRNKRNLDSRGEFAAHSIEPGCGVGNSPFASSAEPLGEQAIRSSGASRSAIHKPDGTAKTAEFYPAHVLHPRLRNGQLRANTKRPLRVMKFGGTSVADALCIARVADIVRSTARDSDVVVVVSAMSGVTNKLVEAATQAVAGHRSTVAQIFAELRERHEGAANELIHSAELRRPVTLKIEKRIQEGERLCRETFASAELTPGVCDAISGLGERLSAPLVAAALAERGVLSEAVEATELVVTNSHHGAAEPFMDLTRDRCESRLRPLLLEGVVAVVTGFIGATIDGVPTTLGRNSSDYSGTIMGAALDADEVTLWTDVDGILTADPKLVAGACSILEMSYLEASNLADLGAKVLHPKTLHALMQRGIPLVIRNTFAPDRPGTRISPTPSPDSAGLKALTATIDAALITVRASSELAAPEILRCTLATAAAVPAHVRLIPQSSSSQCELCIVVPSVAAEPTVEALRRDFAQELAREKVTAITLNSAVAVITVIGEKIPGKEGFAESVLESLRSEDLKVLANAQVSSRCGFSFVVAQSDVKAALIAAHRVIQAAATS